MRASERFIEQQKHPSEREECEVVDEGGENVDALRNDELPEAPDARDDAEGFGQQVLRIAHAKQVGHEHDDDGGDEHREIASSSITRT